jgi:hypothetical protein
MNADFDEIPEDETAASRSMLLGCGGFVAVVIIILLISLLSSCSSSLVMIKTSLHVSTESAKGWECHKEECLAVIAYDEISLLSNDHTLMISGFSDIAQGYVKGTDHLTKKNWEIFIGDLNRMPYLLRLESDSLTIIVGSKCMRK